MRRQAKSAALKTAEGARGAGVTREPARRNKHKRSNGLRVRYCGTSSCVAADRVSNDDGGWDIQCRDERVQGSGEERPVDRGGEPPYPGQSRAITRLPAAAT